MSLDSKRRSLIAAGAACLLPGGAWAQSRRTFTDSAGRKVEVPTRVERIYAAGPPANILVFAIAPDKLIGWTSAWREAERPFIDRIYADLPALGRLTGRILYPEAFPEDLRPIVRDFYTRCYHQTPREAQLDGLLRHAA